MQKPLRVAVIGAGKLGQRHAQVYSTMTDIDFVGVCDVHEEKARASAAQCRTQPFTDHRELLKRVDAVSIVVPSEKHYEISKDFIEAGSHLLIEKPITTRLDEADKLLVLAAKHNSILQVGHIERFNSAVRHVRDIVKEPRFLESHRMGPYDPRVAATGVTLDLMIHDIDIILDLVKSKVKSIDAVGACVVSDTEDLASARIHFENGSVCNMTASRLTPEVQRRIRIFQDGAYISIDYVKQEAQITTRNGQGIHHQMLDITKNDALKAELSDFVDCVRTKRRPLVSGLEGREALAVALEISRQIHGNGR